MKVGELREKLSNMSKKEIIKLTVECYKLIPKAKKENYNIDSLINNPKKKVVKKEKTLMQIWEIDADVAEFIENARKQYYFIPNRIVPKKERSTWRHKVKKWYQELLTSKRDDVDLKLQAEILSDLYELLCESCGLIYFSAYDTFESIGIEQTEFFRSVLSLLKEAEGKGSIVEKGINLVVDNELNRYTLYSYLMKELISFLDIPDLKKQAIEKIKELLKKNNFKPIKSKSWNIPDSYYRKESKNNELAEFGFRLYASLHEYDEALKFYKENYYKSDEEIKLYVLITLLLEKKLKDYIKNELDNAVIKGIELRNRLVELHQKINEGEDLPSNI